RPRPALSPAWGYRAGPAGDPALLRGVRRYSPALTRAHAMPYCLTHSRNASRLSGLSRFQSCCSGVRVASLWGSVSCAVGAGAGAAGAGATAAAAGRAAGLVAAPRGATVESLPSSAPPSSALISELLRGPGSPATRSPVRVFTTHAL